MKYLITGGAGFIGSHVADILLQDKNNIVSIVDNLTSGKKEYINPAAKFYQMDIENPEVSHVFAKEQPEIVFHFAAHIEARESVKNPIQDAQVNILGSLNMLENCRKFKVNKIIFASSGGEIYGDASTIPTPETADSNPISPYGVAKLSVEKYMESYFKMYGLSYVALRYGNVYGSRQNPFGEAGVVAIFANKMLVGEQPIIHGDGNQTKDYVFVEDVVNATIKSCQKSVQGTLNIGTGKETSVIEIFDRLKELTGYQGKKHYMPNSPIAFKRGCLDATKSKNLLGWIPKYSLEEGLRLTVDWFKNTNR